MTNKKGLVLSSGLTVFHTVDNIYKDSSMVKANSNGQINVHMKETFMRTICKVLANTIG